LADLSQARVEAFLEMMSAERGAAANTLSSYQRDLDDLFSFLNGRKVSLGSAESKDLSAYLGDLAKRGFQPTSQTRRLSTSTSSSMPRGCAATTRPRSSTRRKRRVRCRNS